MKYALVAALTALCLGCGNEPKPSRAFEVPVVCTGLDDCKYQGGGDWSCTPLVCAEDAGAVVELAPPLRPCSLLGVYAMPGKNCAGW